MHFDLKPILKALLISTGDPLSAKDIQKLFSRYREEIEAEKSEDAEDFESEEQLPSLITVTQIREALEALQSDLEAAADVYRISEGPQGYRLVCAPEYSDWVRLLRNEPKPIRLSPAALETLTIIAYRQPVTRAEMETIRGVSVDSALNKLIELELVHVLGRADLPGRPLQYGTTEQFLEFSGIKALEELPASDIVSTNKLDSWLRELNSQEEVSDEDVGLSSDEDEEVVSFDQETEGAGEFSTSTEEADTEEVRSETAKR